MNVRVKFRKYGCLKFIGHLDVMRCFQKALRRADIDMCYSEGFSPHMIMSFASPLGLGITSDGEYMDIAVKSSPSSAEAVRRLNAVTAEGIDVVSWLKLPQGSKNAMSIVAAADYEIRFREGKAPDQWTERFPEFMAQPQIMVTKKTKKGQQTVDIRPWVYRWELSENRLNVQLSAGSVHNLKPELLMQAFGDWIGTVVEESDLRIRRLELYAAQGEGEAQALIPLEMMGEEIGEP